LAAAQALPDDTGQATSLAMQYANRNGGGLSAGDIAYSTGATPNDTVTVRVKRSTGGIFTRLFGLSSVNVGSKASARAGVLAQAMYVAPITVNLKHPALHCGGTEDRPVPCFGQPTEIDLLDLHSPGSGDAAGSFGLINLTGDPTGSVGSDDLSKWMDVGYDKMMPLGTYYAVPSSKFNNSQFLSSLEGRRGDEVLFPIYDTLTDPGSNARFNVVGWIAFHITDYHAQGSSGWVKGWFTKVIWRGIQNPPSSPQPPNFGARTIELID
jgi:hypothetical protein